jgi:lysophospholipase L1-like esterase
VIAISEELLATKIDQYLNMKFEVCSWITPGANTEELVGTLEKDFKCLGKKDVIVIKGGANDIGSKRNQTNKVLVKITQFMQKHNNINIIVVNIPHRYDMDRDSVTNLEIQAVNRTLNKMAKAFNHVTIVETDLNRKYFTQHGIHLNKSGTEWLSKLIVTRSVG